VATSSRKQPMFSLDERIDMINTIFADLPAVSVIGYEGLTVDVAQKNNVAVIVRGLRAVSDFEYEFQLATMNRHLEASIETVFLTPTEKFMFVSSTLIREIAKMDGDVSAFVAPVVATAINSKTG
jgi:pantetheine-phosphate adenylyltransferase